jgi:hypothetical protein
VARVGEELQGIAAPAPGRAGAVGGVEDHEVAALLCEVIAHREARLAATDDDDIAAVHGMWTSRISVAVDRSAMK